jgi:hypothetical protein
MAEVHSDYKAIQQLMRSDDVSDFMGKEVAEKVADKANEAARGRGWGLSADPYGYVVHDGIATVSTRFFNNVRGEQPAVAENAKHNTLKKALGV